MLDVKKLKIRDSDDTILNHISLKIQRGDIFLVIGESGSGKSTLGKAIVGIIDENLKVDGLVTYDNENLLKLSNREKRRLMRDDLSICFQNSCENLNPRYSLEEHIDEVLKNKKKKNSLDNKDILRYKKILGLNKEILSKKSNRASGGERQKVLILMSLIINPKIVILDEPTSSLDSYSKRQVLNLIKEFNLKYNTSILLISHDLLLLEDLKCKCIVLYEGMIIERGDSHKILEEPRHPYTSGLLNSSIRLNRLKDVWGIKNGVRNTKGCPFYHRCNQSLDICEEYTYELIEDKYMEDRYIYCYRGGIVSILTCEGIKKTYDKKIVLDDISIRLMFGEIVSIVGRSGIGKSTLVEIIGGFKEKDCGDIKFDNDKIQYEKLYRKKGGIQYIFQDIDSSINRNWTVYDVIFEGLLLNGCLLEEDESRVYELLELMGLSREKNFLDKNVLYLSGGEKQRLAIVRSLSMRPKLLIADEMLSMLDDSIKANLLREIKGLQNYYGFSLLMSIHDIESAVKVSDRIYMLEDSRIIEYNRSNIHELLINK